MKEYVKVNMTTANFCELLKKSIENKTPLSMARLGDGELIHFKGRACESIAQFCKTWGYKQSEYKTGIKLVRKILRTALKNTDIIGLMNPNCQEAKAIWYHEYGPKWGLRESYMKSIDRNKKLLVCNHQAPRGKLLGDPMNFKKLLGKNDLHIISARTEGLKKSNIDKILDTNVFYTQVDISSPLRYRDELFQKIDGIKEDVILVALSYMGKDIPQYLNEKGKICLDFGATIDAWSGIASKPWFKKGNLQSHCLN